MPFVSAANPGPLRKSVPQPTCQDKTHQGIGVSFYF